MGTFVAPFPSPQPIFPTADAAEFSCNTGTTVSADAEYSSSILASADAEFSASIIALLAMHEHDDHVGAGPQSGAPAFAAADANFPLFFAAHEHDHHHAVDATMKPLPPQVFVDLPVNPGTVVHGTFPASGDGGATATGNTSRSGKRRRPPQTRNSQSDALPAARATADDRPMRQLGPGPAGGGGSGSGAPSGGTA